MNEIEQVIYDFIKEHFDIGDDPDFTPDVHLFDSGFVDSLGAIEILDFAEEHWNIEVTQRDLTLYPMNTVEEIAAVVCAKV